MRRILGTIVLFALIPLFACAFKNVFVEPDPKPSLLQVSESKRITIKILKGESSLKKTSNGYVVDEIRNGLGIHTANTLITSSPERIIAEAIAKSYGEEKCEIVEGEQEADSEGIVLEVELSRFDFEMLAEPVFGGGVIDSYVKFTIEGEKNSGDVLRFICAGKEQMKFAPDFDGGKIYKKAIERGVELALDNCRGELQSILVP